MKSVALGVVLNTPVGSPPLAIATSSSFRPSYINIGPNNSPYCFPLKYDDPRRKFLLFRCASDSSRNDSNGGDSEEPLRKEENKQKGEIGENGINNNGSVNENNGNGNANGNGRPRLNLKWVDLLLDPDPDNVVAVGLTGVLAWASVQVLWQLFVISIAILLAALKYSFVAALLIFILITLL